MDSTQVAFVKAHLKEKGSITSNEAIELYGATRLSAIIYLLRHRDGMDIETVMLDGTTRYNRHTKYGKYVYKKKEEDNGGQEGTGKEAR